MILLRLIGHCVPGADMKKLIEGQVLAGKYSSSLGLALITLLINRQGVTKPGVMIWLLS